MNYCVEVSTRAELEIDQAFAWWAGHRSAEQAERWYVGIYSEIATLSENPTRRPIAFENEVVDYELRELHFGLGRRPSHRALFTVRADTVFVISVRHFAQQPLSANELQTGDQ